MKDSDGNQLKENAHHGRSQFVKVKTEHNLFREKIGGHQNASEDDDGSHSRMLPVPLCGLFGEP